MRNLFVLVLFGCFAIPAVSQKPKLYQFDNKIFFQLPGNTELINNNGNQLYSCRSASGGTFVVNRIEASEADIPDSVGLQIWYDSVQSAFVRSQNGKLIYKSDQKLDSLRVRKFTVEYAQPQHFYVYGMFMFLDGVMYCFSYSYDANITGATISEKKMFFESIGIAPGVSPQDQFNIGLNRKVSDAKTVGLWSRYVMILMVIVLVVLWFRKKYRAFRILRAVVASLMLFFAALSILLLLVNTFYNGRGPSYSALGVIAFFAVVGIGLLFVKIPVLKKTGDGQNTIDNAPITTD